MKRYFAWSLMMMLCASLILGATAESYAAKKFALQSNKLRIVSPANQNRAVQPKFAPQGNIRSFSKAKSPAGAKSQFQRKKPTLRPMKPGTFKPTRPTFKPMKPGTLKPVKPTIKPLKPNLKPGKFQPVKPNINVLKPNLNGKGLGNKKIAPPVKGIVKGIQMNPNLAKFAGKFKVNKKAPLKLKQLKGKWAGIIKNGKLQGNLGQQLQAKKFVLKHLPMHKHCHWWVDLCIGLHWHHHNHCWDFCYDPHYWDCWTPCHWNVVYCPGTPLYDSTYWYLGLDGIIVPEAGMGIQKVKPFSPAAKAGLQPGMMILAANGIPLVDEQVLVNAIQKSGGHLHLTVLADQQQEPVEIVVQLQLVHQFSY